MTKTDADADARRAEPPAPSLPPPRLPTIQPSPTELAFDEGFAALRAGTPDVAAAAFARAADAGGRLDRPLSWLIQRAWKIGYARMAAERGEPSKKG